MVGGSHFFDESKDGRGRLGGSGSSQEVSGHRLGRRCGRGRVAEYFANGLRLRGIPERGRGSVGVDVTDLGGGHFRGGKSRSHRRRGPCPLRVRGDDVMGIRRKPVAENLGKHPCTSSCGNVGGFEHEHSRPFTENEAVAVGVERTRSPLRLFVPCRESACRAERCQRQGSDRRLGSSRENDVGGSGTDPIHRSSDRMPARSASGDGALVRTGEAELDCERSGCGVGDHHRDQLRANEARAALEHRPVLLLE